MGAGSDRPVRAKTGREAGRHPIARETMDTKRPKTLTEAYPRLAAPFSSARVRWRTVEVDEQKGQVRVVPYVDATTVMDRLDEVVGPEGWSYDFDLLPDGTVKGKLTILGITKCNRGAIEGNDVSTADKVKGDASDGLKRAAVLFGIGRYLARVGPIWVPYDPATGTFEPPALPDWALPEEERGGKQPATTVRVDRPVQSTSPVGQTDEATPETGRVTAQDFWGLANQALKKGVSHEQIQDIARQANGDWGAALAQLQQVMTGQPEWLSGLAEDPGEALNELFG